MIVHVQKIHYRCSWGRTCSGKGWSHGSSWRPRLQHPDKQSKEDNIRDIITRLTALRVT